MIVATAGHVDHGKTSLVKQLTGVDTDRLDEEKRRGLSINLGFAYIRDIKDQTIGFIDVPGHIRFINNMIAGVCGIDLGMLVVAADDGPMPQTIEHLDIMRLLGVKNYVVVITKIDRVEADRVADVRDTMRALLADACPVFAVNALARISHSPVKTRVFSIQDVNEPGTHQRMAFIRANAPVLVLSDASGVCFSVTF